LFSPLAELGHAEAQLALGMILENGQGVGPSSLGFMYRNEGQGVPQDYKEAVKWYRLSAEQGDTRAQYNLSEMYYKGQGVPQDYVKVHMWVSLGTTISRRRGFIIKYREDLEKKMTPQQIVEAQEMARNWKPNK
jgi:uncharacterized protein